VIRLENRQQISPLSAGVYWPWRAIFGLPFGGLAGAISGVLGGSSYSANARLIKAIKRRFKLGRTSRQPEPSVECDGKGGDQEHFDV